MTESLVPMECHRSTGELHTSQQAYIIASVLKGLHVPAACCYGWGGGDSSFLRNNTSIWLHWFIISLPDFFLINIVSLAPKQTGAKRNISLGYSKLEMY